ncbi:MAG: heme A synthase [Sphingomonadales bacterium]|nr:heme A synthase [Sphingomonadales bacterium]PIX67413.1 MAG: heme A synthase [Sphingomonadales bacterium CG_4_10_14_3_um_filter_58_15]NCO47587.1 heme A synthase [Sphingomonadales bacterium]NCP01623.1 heme A synthase [Sphingomonadales bacterium]NCP26468.1 heme A synthase [Sphingomonadales bacterium]
MTDAIALNQPTGAASRRPIAISNWLYSVAFLVFIMVVVGGITRLTESGLSITEWKPITGALPPLSEADWLSEFRKYQQIPEYLEISGPAGMTLADFKFIYFWEWVHRLLGRLIGVVFALPLLWFAAKRAIPSGYGWRLIALLALGGLQGTIGWWMVSSGLSERTDVSHFRLAVHLLTALFILGGLVWTALDLRQLARGNVRPARVTGLGAAALAVLLVQLLFGAYTAGLNAGYVANTWPLMNEYFVPGGINWAAGIWAALNNDPYLIHFIHRWWAWVVVGFLVLLARKVRPIDRRSSVAIHIAFGSQILLGIATVMTGIDIHLAVLHQAVGALVVAATVWGVHLLGRAPR